MYQKLLVAIDLTKQSEKVLSKACQLARKLNASIFVIYVEPGLAGHTLEEIELGLEGVHEQTMKARQQLEHFCQNLSPAPNELFLCQGEIADQILAHQLACAADLVIMGEHHSFWHLQHTNREVLKKLHCDLLTLPL